MREVIRKRSGFLFVRLLAFWGNIGKQRGNRDEETHKYSKEMKQRLSGNCGDWSGFRQVCAMELFNGFACVIQVIVT